MNARALFIYSLFCVLGFSHITYAVITTLSRNDPAPPYTVDNPFALLGTRRYEYLKGHQEDDSNDKHMSLEIMPFFQRSSRGADSCGCQTELGDINGHWNMIALLPFNYAGENYAQTFTNTNEDLPCGCAFPQILINIRDKLLSDIDEMVVPNGNTRLPAELQTVQGLLDIQKSSTSTRGNFGFFSVPMKYRKRGIRFNAQFYLGGGIGADIQTGFADIHQCATYTDRTPLAKGSQGNPFSTLTYGESSDPIAQVLTPTWNSICQAVSRDLMSQLDNILSCSCANTCQSNCATFQNKSIEDLHAEIFWRYPIEINKKLSSADYPKFLFIPFLAFGGTWGIAKSKNPNQIISLPFGNNGHDALRVRGGFSFDFYETIQLNFEGGGTFFKNCRYCNYPVPTNCYQYPIYPFRTDVLYCPGNNWHIVLGMYARNFFDNWSFNFDYIFVSHEPDCLNVLCNNYAAGPVGSETTCRTNMHPFKPGVLTCKSSWSVQVFNTSLTYNIAPDFSLGVLIQIPVKRKSAYRSTTYMGSLYLSF